MVSGSDDHPTRRRPELVEPPELVAPEGAGLVVDAAPVQAASNVGTDDATSAAPAPRLRNARRLNGGLSAAGVTVDASYSVGDTPPGGLLRWRAPASWAWPPVPSIPTSGAFIGRLRGGS
jgi:hypothetical protein